MSRSTLIKKSLYILCFIAVLMTAVLCVYPGELAYAEVSSVVQFDSTAVLDDLQGMTIDGRTFDTADYPKDPYGELKPLTFIEYCYSQYHNSMGNYGLYIYLYNPSCTQLDENHLLNKIAMAVEFNERAEPSSYEKFTLRFCSKSLDGLFYKFKIIDTSNVILDVIENYAKANAGKRKYYLSELEIVTKGQTNATSYPIGKQYIYEGFAEGYGDSKNFPLSMTSMGIDYITTNLNYAFYRPDGAVGEYSYTQNQLNSAYFSVPNSMIEKYGVLTAVHMQWYEYLTKFLIVVDDPVAYITLSNYIGKQIEAYNSSVRYSLLLNWRTSGSVTLADYHYNYKKSNTSSLGEELDTIYYLFNFASLENDILSSDALLYYIKSYSGSGEKINDKYYAELFEDYVDEGRKLGKNDITINSGDEFSLLNYTFSSAWWQIGWGTHTDNSYSDIEGIREIKSDDFKGSTSTICQNLFIDESCYEDFKFEYDEAVASDSTLFLIRFAVTDYSSYPMSVRSNDGGIEVASGNHFCARQTVFLDLDVIDVTFCDGNNILTTIPVISSPIDAVASASKPIDYSGLNGRRDWTKIIAFILGVLMLIILLIVCAPFLPYILRVLLWVVTLPVKIVSGIFKVIRRFLKRE